MNGSMFCFRLVFLDYVSFDVCHGCSDDWGSEFISELSGYWVQFGRDSNVIWKWIILKLFCDVLID